MTTIKVTEAPVSVILVVEQGPEGPPGDITGALASIPSGSQYKITNIRLDAAKKIVITYNDILGDLTGALSSTPSSGQYKITNIRLDASKHVVITYNDVAEP